MSSSSKKAIITGANRSIGREIALGLASQCSKIAISYHHDEEGAEETVQMLRGYNIQAESFRTDFSAMEQVERFARDALQFLGEVDILINNAAITSREQFLDLKPEKISKVFQVNTLTPLYLTQICAKNMCDHKISGNIINISSIASKRTFSRGTVYASSKAALNKLTENLSLELSPYGIRINAIAPGFIEAGMNADTKETDYERWKMCLEKIPLKRTGLPKDISNMVAFLVSDKAAWITGKIFEVDGGQCS